VHLPAVQSLPLDPPSVKRAHLDRHPAGGDCLASPLQCLARIGRFQHPETAYVLLGLKIRSVGDEHLAVGLRRQRPRFAGRGKAASELPGAGVECVLLLDSCNPFSVNQERQVIFIFSESLGYQIVVRETDNRQLFFLISIEVAPTLSQTARQRWDSPILELTKGWASPQVFAAQPRLYHSLCWPAGVPSDQCVTATKITSIGGSPLIWGCSFGEKNQ
jgi:hypothetical protein